MITKICTIIQHKHFSSEYVWMKRCLHILLRPAFLLTADIIQSDSNNWPLNQHNCDDEITIKIRQGLLSL